jgi:hypothetical protein
MKPLRIEVIDWPFASVLAAKSPAERAWMIEDCQRLARIILAAGERSRHPDWSEEQIARAVTDRVIHGAD